MTILIIRITIDKDPITEEPSGRTAHFIIDNDDEVWYWYAYGGLPLTGGVLAILEAEEATLYAAAVAGGRLATAEEIQQAYSRAWFAANSGAAAAIFGNGVDTLDTGVAALMTALFPGATTAQRNQMRWAIMAGLLTCRCYANGEGLVE